MVNEIHYIFVAESMRGLAAKPYSASLFRGDEASFSRLDASVRGFK